MALQVFYTGCSAADGGEAGEKVGGIIGALSFLAHSEVSET